MPKPDSRSRYAQSYRWMYFTKEWRTLRLAQLDAHPLCQRCLTSPPPRFTKATVAHHKVAHRGDATKFYDPSNISSSCKSCHDSVEQSTEARGYDTTVGCDGWPIDPKHPANTGKVVAVVAFDSEDFWPSRLRPSALPLTMVCGPPAAGKSTYVAGRAAPTDIIIDLDQIVQELGGRPRDSDRAVRKRALQERNRRLRKLAYEHPDGRSAWFITTAAKADTRRQWAESLKPKEVLVLASPIDECLRRIHSDRERQAFSTTQVRILNDWWEAYSPWQGDTPVRGGAGKDT